LVPLLVHRRTPPLDPPEEIFDTDGGMIEDRNQISRFFLLLSLYDVRPSVFLRSGGDGLVGRHSPFRESIYRFLFPDQLTSPFFLLLERSSFEGGSPSVLNFLSPSFRVKHRPREWVPPYFNLNSTNVFVSKA